jgi:hypothetical protein
MKIEITGYKHHERFPMDVYAYTMRDAGMTFTGALYYDPVSMAAEPDYMAPPTSPLGLAQHVVLDVRTSCVRYTAEWETHFTRMCERIHDAQKQARGTRGG